MFFIYFLVNCGALSVESRRLCLHWSLSYKRRPAANGHQSTGLSLTVTSLQV